MANHHQQKLLGSQVATLYRKTLANNDQDVREKCEKLRTKVWTLLFSYPSPQRLDKMTMEVISNSIDTMQNFEALNAAKGFRILESYAKNLAHSAWKRGYRRIKLYSGVIRLKLEHWLRGTKAIFEAMGYRSRTSELILEKRVSSEILEAVALECYIASVEMEIYHDIYRRVEKQGYTYADVHKCRLHCNEDSDGCEIWILKHCEPQRTPSVNVTAQPSPSVSGSEFKPRTHNNNLSASQPERKYVGSPVSMEVSGSDTSGMEPATIDDHMRESMRLLEKESEKQGPLPTVPPPSYQSVYSTGQRDQDWGHVHQKIEELGQKFTDPGGRGDILRGDQMIPSSYSLQSPKSDVVRPKTNDKPMYSIVRDTRAGRDTVVDGKEVIKSPSVTSPPKVHQPPFSSPKRSQPDVKKQPIVSPGNSDMQQEILSTMKRNVDGNRETSVPFSTFGRSPEGNRSTLSPEFARSKPDEKFRVERISSRGVRDESDVYVSLRETSNTSALRSGGKPSFQDNFQKTTQRFYQSDSCQSLPHINDNRKGSVDLSKISQTVPVSTAKPTLMRSTSSDVWQCGKCTFANRNADIVCEMCGASRDKGKDQKLTVGGNCCEKCTFVNEPGSGECKVCKSLLKNCATYI